MLEKLMAYGREYKFKNKKINIWTFSMLKIVTAYILVLSWVIWFFLCELEEHLKMLHIKIINSCLLI